MKVKKVKGKRSRVKETTVCNSTCFFITCQEHFWQSPIHLFIRVQKKRKENNPFSPFYSTQSIQPCKRTHCIPQPITETSLPDDPRTHFTSKIASLTLSSPPSSFLFRPNPPPTHIGAGASTINTFAQRIRSTLRNSTSTTRNATLVHTTVPTVET